MEELKYQKARELMSQLNRMDLDKADYSYILEKVNELSVGIIRDAGNLVDKHRLYRGRLNPQKKPMAVDEITLPKPEYVKGFQRCNPPGQPIFYCNPLPRAIYHELSASSGDMLYLTKWTVSKQFLVMKLMSDSMDLENATTGAVNTFLETKFTQPIHESYSNQYKITSAITEALINCHVDLAGYSSADTYIEQGIGGIIFPSVADGYGSENVALKPDVVKNCLSLDYVEEIKVISCDEQEIVVEQLDVSSTFRNGLIEWAGKPFHWTVKDSTVLFKKERDGWVCRDQSGNVVEPG